jgi:transcriptional regulator with XRE-family HTH domain
MEIKEAFASALKQARKARGLTQEDFSEVSSRTYISTLERGIKSPTIEKIDVLAQTLGIHPLTLLTLTYMIDREDSNPTTLTDVIEKEINQLLT